MKKSLTRVLNDIKTLDKRIAAATNNSFIGYKLGSKLPQGFTTQAELEKTIKDNYNSVKDLITQRNKMKAALVVANATVEVKVGDDTMTIAQAIDRKRTIQQEKNLLKALVKEQTQVKSEIEKRNSTVEANIDDILKTTYGKDRKVSEEEVLAVTKPYREQHEATLIDPLNIRKLIEEWDNKITTFESEVDFSLSEVNAKTEIEVD